MGKPGIVLQDVLLAPSLGHESDHELNRKAYAPDDGFAHEHVGGEGNSGMLSRDPSNTRFSRRKWSVRSRKNARRCDAPHPQRPAIPE
jgi:hypothetical protein